MTANNVDAHVCLRGPLRQPARPSKAGGQPVILKAVYFAEPDSSEDDVLAEIVMHGGEITFSSKCRCCDRREIAVLFADQAKAMDAGESLELNWDAEVEILAFGKVHDDHALHGIAVCAEDRNIVGSCIARR